MPDAPTPLSPERLRAQWFDTDSRGICARIPSALGKDGFLEVTIATVHAGKTQSEKKEIADRIVECVNGYDAQAAEIARLKGEVQRLREALEATRPIVAYLASACEPDADLDAHFGERIETLNEQITAALAQAQGTEGK